MQAGWRSGCAPRDAAGPQGSPRRRAMHLPGPLHPMPRQSRLPCWGEFRLCPQPRSAVQRSRPPRTLAPEPGHGGDSGPQMWTAWGWASGQPGVVPQPIWVEEARPESETPSNLCCLWNSEPLLKLSVIFHVLCSRTCKSVSFLLFILKRIFSKCVCQRSCTICRYLCLLISIPTTSGFH